jgi:endonuclease I
MMSNVITGRIKAELSRIEDAEHVTILYACESGSRAWGFGGISRFKASAM